MTAEGLRLSLAYSHGDGVSESKRVGCVQEAGREGIYAVPPSLGPAVVVRAGLCRWALETDIDKN